MTDVTPGLAAINLAGPRAREIMGRLTDLDVSKRPSPTSTPRGAGRRRARDLLRIGFVGEVGYEIHVPAD